MIRSVIPGTAAEALGLQAGDLITSVNGHPIRTTADTYDARRSPAGRGSEASIDYLRSGDSLNAAGRRFGRLGQAPLGRRAGPLP